MTNEINYSSCDDDIEYDLHSNIVFTHVVKTLTKFVLMVSV